MRVDRASAPARHDRPLLVACYALMVVILLLDAATSAGVVVGLLLSVPIVALSLLDQPRHVVVATAVGLLGFAVAAIYGRGPISPPSVWMPNRAIAVFGIAASGGVALLLQRHRLRAERALRAALSARDTNRLLMSLMAHDLRVPLVAATQALEYAERSAAGGTPPDVELLGDTRRRLGRNLRTVESLLHVARGDIASEPGEATAGRPRTRVANEIEMESASFAGEAEAAGKRVVLRTDAVRDVEVALDGRILRQGLSILLDNAIRHARPGAVVVEAEVANGELVVSVSDQGPGLSAKRDASRGPAGSGLGLELCRALAAGAGGGLELDRDSEQGTRFRLRLPVAPSRLTVGRSAAQPDRYPYA